MGNKIILIGDTIKDINTYGTAIGLSAETPTVTMREDKTVTTLGGAAFVAKNLDALGCPYQFITNADVDHPVVVKHRFWADGYKLLQVNTDNRFELSGPQEDKVLSRILPNEGDVVVFSDYRHGFITKPLIKKVMGKAVRAGATVFVDSQVSKVASNHDLYQYADYMFVNEQEEQYVPNTVSTVVVKMGGRGARMYGKDGRYEAVGIPVNVVDTCGAGDAFLAAFCHKYIQGATPADCLHFANVWAAKKCTLPRMQTPSLSDVGGKS